MNEPNIIHLHSQCYEHDDAHIVGDAMALRRLRDAIDRALAEPGRAAPVGAFAADGEGYDIMIRVVEDMSDMRLPYAEEKCTDWTHPAMLISQERPASRAVR